MPVLPQAAGCLYPAPGRNLGCRVRASDQAPGRLTHVGSEVTIALVTRDRPELTALALESVREAAPGVRIVVLDSGSSPEALAELEARLGGVSLHRGFYPNAAAARNAAL